MVGIVGPNYYTSGTNIMSPKAIGISGWVYDDSSIMSDLSSGKWDKFEMPLGSEDDNPWSLAVPLAEKDCVFGNMMSGLQYNWLQSGKLIELEKK